MTSRELQCPRCRRRLDPEDLGGNNRRDPRCPQCGFRLIVATGGQMEAEVRKRLYGRRDAPVRISGPDR